jgi:hypothetical protein
MSITLDEIASVINPYSADLAALGVTRGIVDQPPYCQAAMEHARQTIDVSQIIEAIHGTHVQKMIDQLTQDPVTVLTIASQNDMIADAVADGARWNDYVKEQAKSFQSIRLAVDAYDQSSRFRAMQDVAAMNMQVLEWDRVTRESLIGANVASFQRFNEIAATTAMHVLQAPGALLGHGHSALGSQSDWKFLSGDIGLADYALPSATAGLYTSFDLLRPYDLDQLVIASATDYLKPSIDYLSSLGSVISSFLHDLRQQQSTPPSTLATYSFDNEETVDDRESVEEPPLGRADAEPATDDYRAATHVMMAEFEISARVAAVARVKGWHATTDYTQWRFQLMLALTTTNPSQAERLRVTCALFEARRMRFCAPVGSVRGSKVERLTTEDIEHFDESVAIFLIALRDAARNKF